MTAEHPEDWQPAVDADEIRRVCERIEAEAATHHADYAAGMREARRIIETELTD